MSFFHNSVLTVSDCSLLLLSLLILDTESIWKWRGQVGVMMNGCVVGMGWGRPPATGVRGYHPRKKWKFYVRIALCFDSKQNV